MILPNAEKAIVNIRKLRDYCLNPSHEVGKHKARVFAAALDLTDRNADELREAILRAVKTHDAIPGIKNEFGQNIQLISNITAPASGPDYGLFGSWNRARK